MSRTGYHRFQFPGFYPDDLLVALDAGFSDEDIIFMFDLDDDERHAVPLLETPMTKSELIQIIAGRNSHLFARDVEVIVSAIFDEITDGVQEGCRVELRGFGAFTVKHRAACSARDPSTGAPLEIVEKWAPAFKPGKGLRDRLNNAG